jgi:hypothetical protein
VEQWEEEQGMETTLIKKKKKNSIQDSEQNELQTPEEKD